MKIDKNAVLLKDLSFAYQDSLVLKNVSFQINKGEFLGIIGPNGGGKTTLLKLLMGFLKPLSGEIQIFGNEPKNALNCIAYVPQTARFDRQFPISVMELVLLGRLSKLPWYGQYSKADKEKAVEALEKVGLLHLSDASFGTLSGGQAQRALIARALVSEPKLLLLDEPTASVDIQAEAEIYQILQSLKGKMTIMMVTHDLGAAINLVKRVILVQGTAAVLDPKEICEHFAVGLYHTPLIQMPPFKGS
ncbi:MAG TPA: ABC transporter ATP-binding protein [Parachlamydiaceae bacterium]|nr:ABC transporter ATP-binding protein [Parachlamydiaceae bacterium]